MERQTTRKPRWQYPPTPMILHLPRRHGGRRKAGKAKMPLLGQKDRRGKLEALFDQERSFDRSGCTFPAPIVVVSGGSWSGDEYEGGVEEGRRRGKVTVAEEEKWRFQAEMLRAECNLLRMEKEIALKKMERRRERMERTLRSAVHSLLSGKQKISEGKNVSKVVEQEISYLVEKLHELSKNTKLKDMGTRDCGNFDRQASILRRRLQKFDDVSDETRVKEIQEMVEASLSVQPSSLSDRTVLPKRNRNMDTLRSNMDALSKGILLERMEREYGSILLTPTSSVSSSTPGSKHIDLPDMLTQQMFQETKEHEQKKECSRHCKVVVRRIVEEVRAETEQWSQMQEMLGQVRDEMEELQASRDFWQDRALDSDFQMQNLRSSVQEWRRKAESSEAKMKSLQAEVCTLQGEVQRFRKDHRPEAKINYLPSETEKRVLICRLKENSYVNNDDRSKYKETINEGRNEQQTVCSRAPPRETRKGSIATRQNGCDALPSWLS